MTEEKVEFGKTFTVGGDGRDIEVRMGGDFQTPKAEYLPSLRTYSTNFSVKLPESLARKVDEIRTAKGISRSRYLRDAVIEQIALDEPAGPHDKPLRQMIVNFLSYYRKNKTGKRSAKVLGVLEHLEEELLIALGMDAES
jgi:metal-responsive CopG/Arc/MetJ family transcriptional regulator